LRKASAGTGTPASEGAVGDNMSRRQAKLEAAAAAASLYGRSFAYPPANILNRYVLEQSRHKAFHIFSYIYSSQYGG